MVEGTINVRKILKQHNLSYYKFARLTGTSVRAIHRFENGENVRPDCRKRIKRGIFVLYNCRVVWPDPKEAHVNFGYSYGSSGGDTYWDMVERCNARYKKLLDYYNEKMDCKCRDAVHGEGCDSC